jgi:hypothetical protein
MRARLRRFDYGLVVGPAILRESNHASGSGSAGGLEELRRANKNKSIWSGFLQGRSACDSAIGIAAERHAEMRRKSARRQFSHETSLRAKTLSALKRSQHRVDGSFECE